MKLSESSGFLKLRESSGFRDLIMSALPTFPADIPAAFSRNFFKGFVKVGDIVEPARLQEYLCKVKIIYWLMYCNCKWNYLIQLVIVHYIYAPTFSNRLKAFIGFLRKAIAKGTTNPRHKNPISNKHIC